jgi:protein-L-isoaspartate(D-aspartate) O-methyltransferase
MCILILGVFWQSGCAFPRNFQQASSSETQLSQTANSFSEQRQRMVSEQIKPRGIKNKAVIEAISKVPRHLFVAPSLVNWAYADSPLPIDYGQTISQPYIVAYMTEMAEINPKDKVLEIGTGCGYQAAILSELAQEVYTIEIIPELGKKAYQTLKKLGYNHVHIRIGDGYEGWPENAPYDSILVTAAPEKIPPALVNQLALNGKMVIPVGKFYQEILILTKTNDGLEKERTIPVRFVPMTTNN